VIVGPDCAIPDHPEVFVIGDMAAAKSHDTGKPVPGVAQGGLQMGAHVGEVIASETSAGIAPAAQPREPFSYWDKGSMAVIGKNKAVAQVGKWHVGGFIAWLMWGVVHVLFLVNYRNRIQVLMSWFWNWIINARDARLITGPARMNIRKPRDEDGLMPSPGDPANAAREPSLIA
jgi:NADH:ubiquinone reductase (H+-translocating)